MGETRESKRERSRRHRTVGPPWRCSAPSRRPDVLVLGLVSPPAASVPEVEVGRKTIRATRSNGRLARRVALQFASVPIRPSVVAQHASDLVSRRVGQGCGRLVLLYVTSSVWLVVNKSGSRCRLGSPWCADRRHQTGRREAGRFCGGCPGCGDDQEGLCSNQPLQ